MNRTLFGIGAVLVTLGIVAAIATIAFHDRWDDDREIEYRVVNQDGSEGDGNVIVVDDGWRGGPRFFPFFPLLVVGGVLIAIAVFSRRHHRGRGDFEDWHREAHWNWGSAGPKEPPPPAAPEA